MSLPTPNLDIRTFQQIVDESKRLIGQRCADWTDHNVSDPGVTLLELFAGMTEMLLFQINQVPEKNYIKFLELLGAGLKSPQPAKTQLRFSLVVPIEDQEGEERREHTLEARKTIAATVRTDVDEAVEFATDMPLTFVRPRLSKVIAIAAGRDNDRPSYRSFSIINEPKRKLPPPTDKSDKSESADEVQYERFAVFQDKPVSRDCLYFGFASNVSGNLIRLSVECPKAGGTGVTDYPSQVWEYWDSERNKWAGIEVVSDTSRGFSRIGQINLSMPMHMRETRIGDAQAYWIRCRYTYSIEDLPPIGPNATTAKPYTSSPSIHSVYCSVQGGTVPASNVSHVDTTQVGISNGMPGQKFKLKHDPILEFEEGETLEVWHGDELTPPEDAIWTPWVWRKSDEDFASSGEKDPHFMCDLLTGDLYLGPSVVQPDGKLKQYGAVPPKGAHLRFSRYRFGGGTIGNIREDQVRILKSPNKEISYVTNPVPASGGVNRESLDRAKLRAIEEMRVRNRAVTAEDFEVLGKEASKQVGRARCYAPSQVGVDPDRPKAGTVRILIVPSVAASMLEPSVEDLALTPEIERDVRLFLNERRLLTTRIEVKEPKYKFISTDITLAASPRRNPEEICELVRERLFRYFHPLLGGPNGDGWPFLRTLTMADLYSQVAAVQGVAFLLKARIYAYDLDPQTKRLGPRKNVPSDSGLIMNEGELLCSLSHRIVPVSIEQIDAEQPTGDHG